MNSSGQEIFCGHSSRHLASSDNWKTRSCANEGTVRSRCRTSRTNERQAGIRSQRPAGDFAIKEFHPWKNDFTRQHLTVEAVFLEEQFSACYLTESVKAEMSSCSKRYIRNATMNPSKPLRLKTEWASMFVDWLNASKVTPTRGRAPAISK